VDDECKVLGRQQFIPVLMQIFILILPGEPGESLAGYWDT
jgi:hypothetical protein